MKVRKRDGQTIAAFDISKIERAIRGAMGDCGRTISDDVVAQVAREAVASWAVGDVLDVESIPDAVEGALMRHRLFDVAKAYILYRQKRAEARQARQHPDPVAVSNYIHAAKYARHDASLGRREVYAETVARVEAMHLRRFGHLTGMNEEIHSAFDLVRRKRVLPSMRSMQFGGPAIEQINNRMYNCSATLVDRLDAFSEAFYLLLCGCGVGYSIQFEHIDQLPELARIDRRRVEHHVVEDSSRGWAEALRALIKSYATGASVEFAYHQIRSEGAPLRTSGGRAPGHVPLKQTIERVRGVLDGAQGRRLRPLEAHRIMCHAADAVLSGGVRRSAMIALFSPEDSEMMYAKTGDWYARDPWFANANNSVVLVRGAAREESFRRVFRMTREWGEPGFFFVSDRDHATNPCGEILLNPKLVIDDDVERLLRKRVRRGKDMPDVRAGEVYTGWSFCNLCEINAAALMSASDLLEAARAATVIGTLQAAYTDMPYLGWVSETIAEREALLGIGMTGMMDSPAIALDPVVQRDVALRVVEWNKEIAERIGIRPAARTTSVKPSGTTSLELGCVGSGHHPHHARRYVRRVIANELEAVFQHFREANPHMCVRKPNGDWVVEFPVEAPLGAIVKGDIGAIQFLEMVRSTRLNWVAPGTARPDSTPGACHNVSTTVQVRAGEWAAVADYMWDHQEDFSGVTLLAETGDKDYAFAPCEAVATVADEARWNQLIAQYRPVDYTALREAEDATALAGEVACAGGACEVDVGSAEQPSRRPTG